jgi:hypothetical protein
MFGVLQANQQPMVVNLSELTLPELQRLADVLSPGSGDSSEAGGGDGASGRQHTRDSGFSEAPAAAPYAAPILLDNRSGVDLWVGQKGVPEHLLLPNGVAMPYLWAAPPALVAGAVRKLQMASAASPAAEAVWSLPFEVVIELLLPWGPVS